MGAIRRVGRRASVAMLALALVVPVLAAPAAAAPAPTVDLKVMSFNILYGGDEVSLGGDHGHWCQDPAGCAGGPLGTVAFATIAYGLNPDGVIVGQYSLTNGGTPHGFVAMPPAK